VVATVTESGYTGSASGTLLISKASPSINFAALGTVGNDQTSITLTATSTSNLPVTFTSSNSSVATVDGNTVTIIGIGTSTITAFQAGDENHHPADSVEQVLTVIRANPLAVPGGPYTVSITADLSLNGSGSLASGGQTISTYEWDLDDSNDAGGFTANVTGAIPTAINMTVLQSTYGMVVGNNLIRLRVTDSAGKISIQSTTVLLTAPLHWDADSNYANGQNDGGGGWLSSLTQWRNVAAGSNTNWISGKDAVFGNGGTGGAVTLASPTTIGSLTFNSFTGTYTLGTSTETITLNNGITMNSGAGAVTIISPITLGAAQSWTNNDDSLLKIETRAVNNAGFLLTIGGTGNTLVHYPTTFIDISGAGGLSKTGAGTLTLSGRNTYTGVTTINGGILKLGEAGIATNTPLGTTAAGTVVSTGATLDLNGFSLGTAEALTLNGTGIANGGALTNTSATAATYSGLLTLGSASSIVASSGNLVLSNTGTITGSGFGLTLGGTNAASSVASIIGTDAGTLTKNGTGTWSLTAENTYTGATTVNAGTLKLDFSAAGAPTTNIISNSSALVLGGGTLNLTGKASTTNSQAGNGTTTLNPGLSAITLSANATANPLSLNLGAITRNAGSALRITLPTGTPSATNGVLTTSGTAGQILLSNGVAFATIGTTGWAGMDATNTFIAPVTYTAATPTSLSGNASLNTMMGTTTLSSNTTITSLRAAMSRFYTVNINAGLTLTTGGILVGSGVDDGGVFYINGPGSLRGPAGQELVFLNHPLGITRYHPSVIAAPIVDNGSATGFTYSGLVPASGMGELLFLTGTNTYTGTTRILGGTLSIGNGGTTGSLHPSSQIVNDGTLIINRSDNVAQGTIFASTISGSGSLTKSGTGTLTLTGTNTYSGNTTVNAGTLQIGADNALGSSILVLNGGAIEASGASRTITAQVNLTASSSVVGSQDVTFSNTFYQNYVNNTLGGVVLTNNLTAGRKLTINGTVPIKRQWDPSTVGFGGTGDTVINGSITQGDQSSGNLGNLFKSGTGTLTLSGANTYYGLTTVNQGKLFINGSTAASDITVASGATLGGSGTLGGNATIAAGGKLEFNLSTPAGSHNPLDFASGKGLSFSGASELTISISVGAAPGTYVLVSGGNNITGIPPATLRLPSGCNASVSIVGNELRLVITAIGDITPPSLDNITDNLAGDNIILINTVVTYTVSFNEDIDAATLTDPDFSNAGTSSITIGTITETSPGVFNVPVTPTTPGTLRLRIPTTAVIQDISANALITSPAIDDETTVTVTDIPYTAWSNAGSFNTDSNNDGVPNGLAWLLGASNPSVNARASLPAAVQNSGNIILTFRTLKTSARGTASIKVQYSKDLGVTDLWTNHEVEVPGTAGNYANYNSSGINFVISNPSGDYIDVQATIPASAAAPGKKLFARVKGTTP
jgi:autotransporter-associated beta strand protein